jgi:hypothetical protein
VVQVFAQPYMYWVGMDTDPRTTPEALAEFNRFYSTTHVHEVLAAHPGFVSVSRYELHDQDPRGGEHHGPRWLAVYEAEDEAAALQYIKDNERPWLHRRKYSPWPAARRKAKTVWRMLWRRLPESHGVSGETLQMLGTNVLLDQSAEAHTDLELYRAFAHPQPGCPRYCMIADGDAALAVADDERVWQLVYRRLPPPD